MSSDESSVFGKNESSTLQTYLVLPDANIDIGLGNCFPGPMVQSIRLLLTTFGKINQYFSESAAFKILQAPFMVHHLPLCVFIDIDLIPSFSNEFKEICFLFLQNDNFIYGFTSKTKTDISKNDEAFFTEIYFNCEDAFSKARKIVEVITEIPTGMKYRKLFFGEFALMYLLQSNYCDDLYNRNLAFEFIIPTHEDDNEDIKPSSINIDSFLSLNERVDINKNHTLLLKHYTIIEHVLFYIVINKTIKSFCHYFENND